MEIATVNSILFQWIMWKFWQKLHPKLHTGLVWFGLVTLVTKKYVLVWMCAVWLKSRHTTFVTLSLLFDLPVTVASFHCHPLLWPHGVVKCSSDAQFTRRNRSSEYFSSNILQILWIQTYHSFHMLFAYYTVGKYAFWMQHLFYDFNCQIQSKKSRPDMAGQAK